MADTLIFTKGDWAGNVWSTSGCGTGTCPDCKTINLIIETPMSRLADPLSLVVNNNPSKFSDAYWAINSLRVYTPQAQQSW
jgi:hypothetical protein